MKKFSLLLLALLLCLVCSCGSSGSKEKDDSDQIDGTDVDTTDDSDADDGSDTDKTDDSDNQKPASDDDNTADDSDSEAVSGICSPNPCDTEENRAAHKSRCMPENEGTAYTCVCDSSYYSYGDICCPAHSSEKGGKCECDTYYTEPEEEPGICVAECTENTIEGLNGYCKKGSICQQGTCIKDHCADYTCPENSTCTTKNDEAFCQCESPLQMSNGKCCPKNSTNVNGTCKCNAGYELSGDSCVMSANNPCRKKPCSQANNPGQPNKNTCVPDSSEAGYHCECNTSYEEDSDGKCKEIVYDVCPNNMQCLRGYCLPHDLSNEQCIKDSDCREFGGNATCSAPNAAGGVCSGCTDNSDCPGNTQCNDTYGTCALMCDSDDDCPYGKCYSNGYCGQKHCSTDEDCFNGSVCKYSTGDGDGMCQRATCKETVCSETNPGGSCPDGASCINGSCVSSCEPNPCNEINRTTCEKRLGVPTCVCDEGTVEKDGKCQPEVKTCPSGFVCKNGYCADKSDPAFFCAENSDCGSSLTCSPTSPSGTCSGCSLTKPCPGADEEDSAVSCSSTSTETSGYCMRSCLTDEECNIGMICKNGSCGSKECSKPSDCPANYTCKPSTTISASNEIVEIGICKRKPCE